MTGGLNLGGSQRIASALARESARAGHQVTLWNLGASGGYECELRDAGVEVVALQAEAAERGPRSVIRLQQLARMSFLMASGRWDVVHSHLSGSAAVSLGAALNSRVVWVTSYHGRLTTSWRRVMARVLAMVQDRTIVVSRGVGDHLCRDCGVSESRMSVIHNGLPRTSAGSSTVPTRAQLGWSNSDIVVGCIGRLVAHKGQMLLVEAFRILSHELPHLRLLLIGNGPDMNRILSATEDMRRAGRIVLLGEVEDACYLVPLMDVLTVPSLFEGFSLTALEAMRTGVPVVATDAGGAPEVVADGVTGRIFRSGDANDLAKGLRDVIQGDMPEMGAAGLRRFSSQFTEDRMFKQHLELYSQLLARCP